MQSREQKQIQQSQTERTFPAHVPRSVQRVEKHPHAQADQEKWREVYTPTEKRLQERDPDLDDPSAAEIERAGKSEERENKNANRADLFPAVRVETK